MTKPELIVELRRIQALAIGAEGRARESADGNCIGGDARRAHRLGYLQATMVTIAENIDMLIERLTVVVLVVALASCGASAQPRRDTHVTLPLVDPMPGREVRYIVCGRAACAEIVVSRPDRPLEPARTLR